MNLRGTVVGSTSRQSGQGGDAGFSESPQTVGIWRLMEPLHSGPWTELFTAQPADAAGSPRCDYVLKIARHRLEEQAEGALQIRGEIAAAASIRHPNVMTILDHCLQAARPYLVMPRLEAATLQQLLDERFAQPLPVVLWWARQAAQGTVAIHAEGWVHRDLKPANLMVSPQGHVTILDFGFATQANNVADPIFRGTPQFAAPEVLRGDTPANPAADVYALGCLLKRMLTISQQGAPLPEAVEALLGDTLAERPQQRPAAASLVDRLLRLEIETLGRHIRPQTRAA